MCSRPPPRRGHPLEHRGCAGAPGGARRRPEEQDQARAAKARRAEKKRRRRRRDPAPGVLANVWHPHGGRAPTIPDLITFIVAGLMVLAGRWRDLSRNPVHSALSLVLTSRIAVLFIAQQAEFLAAVQVIVYAGAIVVLFLFVIMFLGVDKRENIESDPLRASDRSPWCSWSSCSQRSSPSGQRPLGDRGPPPGGPDRHARVEHGAPRALGVTPTCSPSRPPPACSSSPWWGGRPRPPAPESTGEADLEESRPSVRGATPTASSVTGAPLRCPRPPPPTSRPRDGARGSEPA